MNRKTTLRRFQATNEIACKKTWKYLQKWSLKKETESLLIVTQNIAIRANYVQAKIDKTQGL